MEYCGAGSVCDIMKICDKTLTEDQISVVCKDVLNGLSYLHSLRKIHRDIKAGNILLNSKGASKLADFGVSGQLSDTMAKRQTVIGTPFWMAPEVIQEVGYDVKADIWSLGITCIEMAESKPPYSNVHPMRAIFMIPSRAPPRLTEPEKWSIEFNDFVGKCLTKNPDQRPSAHDLLVHPFIQKSKLRALLQPLLDQQDQIISRIGRDSALGVEHKEEDSDEEDEEGEESAMTVKRGEIKSHSTDYSEDNGTIVISDDKNNYGTVVVASDDDDDDLDGSATVKKGKGSNSKYVPQFMDQFKQLSSQQPNSAATPSQQQQQQQDSKPIKMANFPPGNPKYESLTLEQLKKMVEDLDIQKEREIAAVRDKYATNKRNIMTAIEERKTGAK